MVGGSGPRGGRGLIRLDHLENVLSEAGLDREVSVFTDGLAPNGSCGARISLCTPESVAGGVVGLLRDGDSLRVTVKDGRIRAGVNPVELNDRTPPEAPPDGAGYASRYTRRSRPALEGGSFA